MNVQQKKILSLSANKIKSIAKDPIKTAEMGNLVYVKDADPGIKRVRKGNSFCYFFNKKNLRNKRQLDRIRKLLIPPAWENVWICVSENGHLQATGFDVKRHKQYRYHPLWNSLRNQTKFYRLYDFGKTVTRMRERVAADLALPGLPLQKILALVVSLMERTDIRVGNDQYEKLYGSYGLTTLKDRHVSFKGSEVRFSFKGKKGVKHSISIHNKRLANLVRRCRDIPGKELFQYIDEQGVHRGIDSGMVNAYIREISGKDFSAKDFRTWSGTLHALVALKELGAGASETDLKKKLATALDLVSKQLGNTRNVCKKYYIHPVVISLYENKRLENYFKALEIVKDKSGLSNEERILMKIFEKEKLIQETGT